MNTQEKIAVMQAWLEGKKIVETGRHNALWYEVEGEPVWNWGLSDYRVKPEEVTKPSIDWDHVPKYFRFLATDQAGLSYLFEHKPVWSPTLQCWTVSRGEYIPARYYQSFNQGLNCPPEDSLVERPEE